MWRFPPGCARIWRSCRSVCASLVQISRFGPTGWRSPDRRSLWLVIKKSQGVSRSILLELPPASAGGPAMHFMIRALAPIIICSVQPFAGPNLQILDPPGGDLQIAVKAGRAVGRRNELRLYIHFKSSLTKSLPPGRPAALAPKASSHPLF